MKTQTATRGTENEPREQRHGTAGLRFKYVWEDVDRYGNVRFYFARKGQPKIRLRGQPGSPQFAEEYAAALKGTPQPKLKPGSGGATAVPSSFRWLRQAYLRSADFNSLALDTQYQRRAILDRICEKHGDKPFARMEARHIRRFRDEKAETPEAANTVVKALRRLFAFAVADALCDRNPARDVPYIKTGSQGHHTWTIEEVRRFEARHPIGTKARLTLALLLYTGQRRSDVVAFGRAHVRARSRILDGRRIETPWLSFVQAKNRKRKPVALEIPILPELQRIIDATPSGHATFLVTAFGRPFSPQGFSNKFRAWCDEAGLPHCSAHGLRKAAATIAAENGATEKQLMSIFGWTTLSQAAHYTRAARQRVLAGAAMPLLVPAQNETALFPLSDDQPSGRENSNG